MKDTRTQEFKDCEYKGVTYIINEVFGRDFSQIPKQFMKPAQERGKDVHAYIEHYLRGERYTISPEHYDYKRGFHKWLEQYDEVKPLHLELEMIDNKYEVKGIADFVGYLDGELHIIDWKTSSSMRGDTLFDAMVQSLIYRDMLARLHDLEATPLVVSVQRDKFTEKEVDIDYGTGDLVLQLYEQKKKVVKRRSPVLYNVMKNDIIVIDGVTKREAKKFLKREKYRGREGYSLERI